MLSLLRKFRKSRKGLAAVEFAFVAPVLGVLLVGTIEVCNALSCKQKVTSVASTVADLVSQTSTTSTSDLSNIFDAAAVVLFPFPSTSSKIVVTSIVSDGTGNGTVAWSQASSGSGYTKNTAMTVPTGLMSAANCAKGACSVIFAQVTYNYTSPMGKFFLIPTQLSDYFYTRPRESALVSCTDCT
ncbi:MAG: TadE/TadG family type IV pilus assembly protein [Rhizomicrobium sp.]|jgi:Flp pilus assembly protein TadG